jgi:hypothetical protein
MRYAPGLQSFLQKKTRPNCERAALYQTGFMLPEAYHQHYQSLRQSLQRMREAVVSVPVAGSALQEKFQTAQRYQQLLTDLDLEGLNPAVMAKVRSYQTEINKQLRLLGTDVMFLRTARQAATLSQRQTQMSDRIDTLIRYCNALLEE